MQSSLRALLASCLVIVLAPGFAPAQFLKKQLSEWREELKHPSPDKRRSAAFALGQMGRVAVVALDEILGLVRADDDAGVRDMAARAIGDVILGVVAATKPEAEWKKAGKDLQAALKSDSDPRVRRSAAYALGAFGETAAPGLVAVRAAMRDRSALVRQNAVWAIGKIGDTSQDTLRELCVLLGDRSPLVRRLSAASLAEINPKLPKKSSEAALALLKMLRDENDDVVTRTALGALATMADESLQRFASDIYPLLESKDSDTARAAAFVLGNMGGEPATKALPQLIKTLADPDPGVQIVAAACLANSGRSGAPALEDLTKVFKATKHLEVRSNCAIAIGLISEAMYIARDARAEAAAEVTVPALMEALKIKVEIRDDATVARTKEQLREDAAEAISRIGAPYNKKSWDLLAEILEKDTNQVVRQRAIWSLFYCDDFDRQEKLKKAVIGVLEETVDTSLIVRYDAARLLAVQLKENAPDRTVEILLEMLGNNKLRVFYGSGTSVKNIASETTRGDASITARKGGDARYMAAVAFGHMIKKIKKNDKVRKALEEAARDTDTQLKKHASSVLEDLKKGE